MFTCSEVIVVTNKQTDAAENIQRFSLRYERATLGKNKCIANHNFDAGAECSGFLFTEEREDDVAQQLVTCPSPLTNHRRPAYGCRANVSVGTSSLDF